MSTLLIVVTSVAVLSLAALVGAIIVIKKLCEQLDEYEAGLRPVSLVLAEPMEVDRPW